MKKISFLLHGVFAFGFVTASLAQVPKYVPTNGLVGWWPFNGNANDQSVNRHNGTVTGATLVSDRFGNNSSAYFFNYKHWVPGSGGDEIYIPYTSILAPKNITVSVWAYRTSAGYPNQNLNIINRFEEGFSTPNGQTWALGVGADPETTIYCVVYQAALNNNQANLESNGPYLSLNTWNNIVMTFDGLALKQFINGVMIDSVSANGLTLNTTGTSGISIGVSDQASGIWSPFDGKIDDIGIWNRALSQKEITDLYNANNVGINENTQDNLLSLYPNPAQSQININADIKLIGEIYSIYDNNGKLALTGKLNSQNTTIDLGNLSGGLYMFSVGENMKQSFKVIKE
ncbi:MAG: T9SS type A sorting domain-containing protein [Bacteroidetes bacterium]|nr:T9SS type A sorting domain-containing protein [Bacteroidota bacterium]